MNRQQGLERASVPWSPLETRSGVVDAEGWTFAGYASAFHRVQQGWVPEIVQPGAYAATLARFLDEGLICGVDHAWDHPIGLPLEVREDDQGLFIRARLSDTAAGREAATLLRDGVVKRMSVGFRAQAVKWLDDLAAVQGYWDEQGYTATAEDLALAAGGVRLITRARLYEVSPVGIPANGGAVVTEVDPPASAAVPDAACLSVVFVEMVAAEAGLALASVRLVGVDR